MKDRTDFELDTAPARSIRDIIIEQIAYTERDGKTNNPLQVQNLDELMQAVFARIEQQALKIYKSNEIWALRKWCLEHILTDQIVDEVAVKIADGLINPVVSWQEQQEFDPIQFFKHRLTNTLRLSEGTVRVYMQTAAKFVAMVGRKKSYSDDEVMQYLDWAGGHFKSKSSYVCECQRLLQFLRNLPGADRKRDLPIPMPRMPDRFNQPMFTDDDVETLAWASVILKLKPNMVVRLVVASIYGGRKSELAELSSGDFHLDGEKSYIYIATKKGGDKRKQPIPASLVPLFSVSISPINPVTLHARLRNIVDKIGVEWKHGSGFHSFRRNVVTMLDSLENVSDLSQSKFMRWATPRYLSMLDRYRRKPSEESDAKILSQHPRVKLWQEIIPLLIDLNPYYRKVCNIDIYTYL